MEKGAVLKKNYELMIFGVIFLSILISCVIATNNTHEIMSTDGETTLIVKEDQPFTFNFTINNSFSDNLTWVNITISETFAFLASSDGTSTTLNLAGGGGLFSNTSTMLSWGSNTTYAMVYPDTNQSFWFNATPSNSGSYTLIFNTANSTSSFVNTTTLTVTVLEIHNVMTTTGTRNFSVINEDTSSLFNITLNSTVSIGLGNITNITITFPSGLIFEANSEDTELYSNSSKAFEFGSAFTNTSTSITWVNTTDGLLTNAFNGTIWFNLTATDPGTYNFTVTTVNSQDAGIHQQNFTVSVRDITNPAAPTYNCSKTRFTEGESPGSCSCTATDNYDATPTLSYTSTPTTTNAGTYTITCTATDDATYNSSISITYTVDASGGDYSPGSGGTSYTNTYVEDTKEFSEIKQITKELKKNEKIRIMFSGIKHNIGLTGLTTSTATIEIFSTPQTATLSVGDIRKFDLNDDGYYDLSITLNEIEASKADVILKSVYEEITKKAEATEEENDQAAGKVAEKETGELSTEGEPADLTLVWAGIIIVIVIGAVLIVYMKKKKKKK